MLCENFVKVLNFDKVCNANSASTSSMCVIASETPFLRLKNYVSMC